MAFVNLPPNLKDIFYGLSDRIAKLETGPNQALYYAESAQTTGAQASSAAAQAEADALTAQAQATAAQASAQTAYSTAVAAGTAASNAQTTANGKNKVTYSTATPGTTANTLGDIWYQYGTSGPNNGRVIAQYSGAGGSSWTQTTISGLVVANIDAASITTGTLSVGLGITTGTGTFTVNASTGALFANSATIQGQVSATSGYFGSSTNGYSITSTGLVGIGSGVIIGGQIQTSTGNEAIIMNGPSNAIQFKAAGSVVANMVPLTAGGAAYGLLMHYGATPDPSGGTRPQIFIGSGNVSMNVGPGNGTTSNTIAVSNTIGPTISGNLTCINEATVTGEFRSTFGANNTVTNAASTWMSTTGQIRRVVSSSLRYKENVVDLVSVEELHPRKLLNLPVRAFTYKDKYMANSDDRYQQLFPGFIAEEVDAIYPMAADYENGDVESWNDRILVPAMLALIQDQETRITKLEGNNG
jgi:hypothetical protein